MKLQAFHKLSYGLYLVASEHNGQKAGYIANTVFQVTSKPPQLAISCHKNNKSAEIIKKSGVFSVSVLKKDLDVKLIGDFGFISGNNADKFKGVNIEKSKTGAPIVLNESVAWFDCKIKDKLDVGTHWLFIGEVVESDLVLENDPLTYEYYREEYKMLSPQNSPTFIEQEKLEAEKQTSTGELQENGAGEDKLQLHICQICGWVYDPAMGDPTMGIEPGTPFDELPDDFRCPICNATKNYFIPK